MRHQFQILTLMMIFTVVRAEASSSLGYTYQNYTNNITTVLEYQFNEEPANDAVKATTFNLGLTVTETQGPQVTQTVFLSKQGPFLYFTPGFATTIFNNQYDFTLDYDTPTDWSYGFEVGYSRQMGSGTSTVFSESAGFQIGKKYLLGPKSSGGEGFTPSVKPNFRVNYAAIDSKPFSALLYRINTSNGVVLALGVGTIGEQTIANIDYDTSLDFDIQSWLSAGLDYQLYNFDSDPNKFSYFKNPALGTPTSLTATNAGLSLTFHMSEKWDLSLHYSYAVAATSDAAITNEWSAKLTYNQDLFSWTLGTDHVGGPGDATQIDYFIAGIKYNY